jgi:hypothetical protein
VLYSHVTQLMGFKGKIYRMNPHTEEEERKTHEGKF